MAKHTYTFRSAALSFAESRLLGFALRGAEAPVPQELIDRQKPKLEEEFKRLEATADAAMKPKLEAAKTDFEATETAFKDVKAKIDAEKVTTAADPTVDYAKIVDLSTKAMDGDGATPGLRTKLEGLVGLVDATDADRPFNWYEHVEALNEIMAYLLEERESFSEHNDAKDTVDLKEKDDADVLEFDSMKAAIAPKVLDVKKAAVLDKPAAADAAYEEIENQMAVLPADAHNVQQMRDFLIDQTEEVRKLVGDVPEVAADPANADEVTAETIDKDTVETPASSVVKVLEDAIVAFKANPDDPTLKQDVIDAHNNGSFEIVGRITVGKTGAERDEFMASRKQKLIKVLQDFNKKFEDAMGADYVKDNITAPKTNTEREKAKVAEVEKEVADATKELDEKYSVVEALKGDPSKAAALVNALKQFRKDAEPVIARFLTAGKDAASVAGLDRTDPTTARDIDQFFMHKKAALYFDGANKIADKYFGRAELKLEDKDALTEDMKKDIAALHTTLEKGDADMAKDPAKAQLAKVNEHYTAATTDKLKENIFTAVQTGIDTVNNYTVKIDAGKIVIEKKEAEEAPAADLDALPFDIEGPAKELVKALETNVDPAVDPAKTALEKLNTVLKGKDEKFAQMIVGNLAVKFKDKLKVTREKDQIKLEKVGAAPAPAPVAPAPSPEPAPTPPAETPEKLREGVPGKFLPLIDVMKDGATPEEVTAFKNMFDAWGAVAKAENPAKFPDDVAVLKAKEQAIKYANAILPASADFRFVVEGDPKDINYKVKTEKKSVGGETPVGNEKPKDFQERLILFLQFLAKAIDNKDFTDLVRKLAGKAGLATEKDLAKIEGEQKKTTEELKGTRAELGGVPDKVVDAIEKHPKIKSIHDKLDQQQQQVQQIRTQMELQGKNLTEIQRQIQANNLPVTVQQAQNGTLFFTPVGAEGVQYIQTHCAGQRLCAGHARFTTTGCMHLDTAASYALCGEPQSGVRIKNLFVNSGGGVQINNTGNIIEGNNNTVGDTGNETNVNQSQNLGGRRRGATLSYETVTPVSYTASNKPNYVPSAAPTSAPSSRPAPSPSNRPAPAPTPAPTPSPSPAPTPAPSGEREIPIETRPGNSGTPNLNGAATDLMPS